MAGKLRRFHLFNKREGYYHQLYQNQKDHHRNEPFYDEYKRLLIEHGVEFNEKYLL